MRNFLTSKIDAISGRIAWALVLTTAVACTGCGGSGGGDDNRPDRTQISGVVTLDGAPVEGALITFHPMDPAGSGANGRSGAAGEFVMGTFSGDDGVIPGSYQVTISKITYPGGSAQVGEDDPNYDPNAPEPKPVNALPEKFNGTATSGLKADVTTSAVTDLKFDLTSK